LAHGVEGTQMLMIHNGDGDGEYPNGTRVRVSADRPPVGQRFAGWTGDISILANPFLATTSATIPAADVSLTATYKAVSAGTTTAEADIAELMIPAPPHRMLPQQLHPLGLRVAESASKSLSHGM
jgi:hypothetical protein